MVDFSTLSLSPPLVRAVEVLGFTTMTPVQIHALPPALAGRDVIAQARTGSGKTVAFGLAILSRLDPARAQSQALVLCPTRELADQVSGELRRLARFIPNLRIVTLCGGVPVRTQTPALVQPPHVVVGTPGRILDHLRRGTLAFAALRVLVLDEADRMLGMGFSEAIAEVVAQLPKQRQTLLYSATFPDDIRALSRRVQHAPVEVTVDVRADEGELTQRFFEVDVAGKADALVALLATHRPASALVFCHTRNDCRDVAAMLIARGHAALALHGELEQRERDEVLVRLAHGSCTVLVATDVAARGLDVKGLGAVVSWELPVDPDLHVHRVGRTGRAGERGLALHLVAARERGRARAIAEQLGLELTWAPLPPPPTVAPPLPDMITLMIQGGRQDKLRPGDVLGALTRDVGLPGDAVGKIDVLPARTYVSVRRAVAAAALRGLGDGKIKGRRFRVSRLR